MILVADRCRIRPYQQSDLASLVRYANDPLIAAQLRDRFPHPYTEETGRAFLATAAQAEPLETFAIEVDGEAVGGIGVHAGHDVMRGAAEVGYWLGRPFWGRGIPTSALRAVVDHVFQRSLYGRLHAHTFEGNTASQRVLEKCGFQCEGVLRKAVLKNGRFLDAILFGIVNDEALEAFLKREKNGATGVAA